MQASSLGVVLAGLQFLMKPEISFCVLQTAVPRVILLITTAMKPKLILCLALFSAAVWRSRKTRNGLQCSQRL
jgi:hypothetical protein